MRDPADRPEPDRLEGAPHPRDTARLLGQGAAEATFLDAYRTGRLHHAWLLAGPRGIGKATLAWRIARFLLATPPDDGDNLFGAPSLPETLDIPADHPVARRIAAGSEAGLSVLRRPYDEKTERLRQAITVDEVRRLKSFFTLSATEGGRRVVVVDAADEMNTNAANALLKLLEEPPARATLLLIAHQPSALLPTIRSRCRALRLQPLSSGDLGAALTAAGAQGPFDAEALTTLTAGSVGDAFRLLGLDGLALYAEITALFTRLPQLDRPSALKLAETAAARGADARTDLVFSLFELFLTRLARTGVAGPPAVEAARGEAELLARLSPDTRAAQRWATLQRDLGARARHGRAVNLDPSALLLDMVLKITQTARA